MNEHDEQVRKLLTDFADRAVSDHPAADVEADVTRGRRALRRLRVRRRTAGVLVCAAAVAAVAATGGPGSWFAGDGPQVASDAPGATQQTQQTKQTQAASARPQPAATRVLEQPLERVVLAKNSARWSGVGCGLAPAGWHAQRSLPQQVVLAPPYSSNSDGRDLNGKLVLRSAEVADPFLKPTPHQQPGRLVFLGWYAAGERAAQVKLGEDWLIVRLPRGAAGWNDATLLRLVGSCTVSKPATPTVR
ncbi:MAG: hypothetical protein ACRDP9_27280 [Kribbellaceae bacterium]